MSSFPELGLAGRNFVRNRRRYRVLLAALVLAVAALVVMIGLIEGVHLAVREKASRYFAGDLTVQSFRAGSSQQIGQVEALRAGIHKLELPLQHIVERSIYTNLDSTLFFAGGYINQRRLAGVDWEVEGDILGRLSFVDGGLPSLEPQQNTGAAAPESAVLISAAVAERLGARVGDEIILALTTNRGRRNTINLVVSGIFEEHSFFGYVSYLDRETLNRARELPAAAVSEIGLHLQDRRDQERVAALLYEHLHQELELEVMPVWRSRDDRTAALGELGRGDQALGIMTLEAHLDEVNDLLNALSIIAGAAVGLFLAIVIIGVFNTYVMITFERTKEIGTLRALGLTRSSTLRLFVSEAAIMGVTATVMGIPAGVLLLEAARRLVNLQGNPVAELFLVDGQLMWSIPAFWPPLILGAVVAASVSGSLQPAFQAAFRLQPSAALQKD